MESPKVIYKNVSGWIETRCLHLALLLCLTSSLSAQIINSTDPFAGSVARLTTNTLLGVNLQAIAARYQQQTGQTVTATVSSLEVNQLDDSLFLHVSDEKVAVTIRSENIEALIPRLETVGFEVTAYDQRYYMMEGMIPTSQIMELEKFGTQGLLSANVTYAGILRAGSVTSQADFTMESDRTNAFPPGLDGTGVNLGIISDSYNRLGGAAAGEASGDLPSVTIIEESTQSSNIDEGRAMAELVHDMAPGAALFFAAAFNSGEMGLADNIRDLADPAIGNCDVIVDDVAFLSEPFFQNGIVGQAVDEVVTMDGAVYYSSAGNSADQAFELETVNTQNTTVFFDSIGNLAGTYIDVDPGAGVDVNQSITIAAGTSIRLSIQWDDPFYTVNGVDTDLAIIVTPQGSSTVTGIANQNNIGLQSPVELVSLSNPGSTALTFDLYFFVNAGPAPGRLKWINFNDDQVVEHDTNSPTISGHTAAPNCISVGAVPYFDQDNPESFTSLGPTTFLFEDDGTVLATPSVRQTPDLAAIDGTNTTFFGNDIEGDTFPNFFGTSAAAPHAAAVAALMLQNNSSLTPAQILANQIATAEDLGDPGYDNLTGNGLVNAFRSVYGNPTPATLPFTEDFEDGALDPAFITDRSAFGRILTTSSNGPAQGSQHVTLDSSLNVTGTSLNEITLHVDLASFNNVMLSYFQREYGDEDNAMPATFTDSSNTDGVAFSVDGTNWFRVESLTGGNSSSAYTQKTFNLSTLASNAGVTLGSSTRIRFQQFDNQSISNDGMAFDSISVTGTAIPDTTDPVAVCQNITVQLDATGNASITAADVDGGSTDNIAIASLSVNPSSFTCANIGANNVVLTVTDTSGNTDTCNATVTVEDNISPTAVCQNITVQLDGTGNASITAAQIDNGSSDNCSLASFSLDQSSFTASDLGANSVTLTVTDSSGNTDTCNATVTVEDTTAPTAVCQNITVQLDATGNASITAADVDGGSSDNVGIASISIDNSSFTCNNIGANTVTLTVTDTSGNTDTCNATVTVEDNVAPTAVCQNITVQLDSSGNATITAAQIDNGSSDNCTIASFSLDQTTFTGADLGANTVTLTVTDNSGNSSTCNATVTVEDNVNPTAVCQDIAVQLDATGNASITAAQIDGGSTDNVGIASLSINTSSFTCDNIGLNTVTLTVTDTSGNTATCNATVTVEDSIAPTAVCQNITVQLDATGNASITAAQLDGGSTDNCSIALLSIDQSSFTGADLGANTVTLTVTDSSDNSSTCNATVTVEDNIAPTAVCQNITVQLDGTGNATITPNDVDGGSTDNVGIASLSIDTSSFTCADVGPNTVTLTVTDTSGNTATCNATVSVEDTTAPTAVCQNIAVQLDGTGVASITAAQIDNGSSDNCGIALFSLDQTTFTGADLGANTVTLTVTDGSGNSSTCNATVTVEDNIDPVAVCQNITVQLDATGNASITAAQVDGGSTDNVGIASLSINTSTFTCANVGANTVTLTVTDTSGNTNTCNATVTVEDSVAPVAVCQNITVQLDGTGNASITAAQIDNGSSDNCGIASLSLDQTTFTGADLGANNVTLTVTDVNGNTDTCVATVTVEDNTNPVAVCQNITVQLDGTGNATIAAGDVDGGSSDNVGIASLSVDTSAFTCADIGANTVTLTVTDTSGNTATCNATVTVEDNVAPVAVCQNITVQLDINGNVSITAAQVDGGSSDNCSIASLSIDQSAFTEADLGANTVTLTVTDVNGNSSTCNATVTVEENGAPIAVCQNITVELDATGNVTITGSDVDGGSTSGNGIASLSVTPNSFTCADIGANTVTLTVTDITNETDTCDAIVTVVDNAAPTVVFQPTTIQLDATGNASITAADVDGGSTDNCSIASLSIDQSAFTCADVGTTIVTLTATDTSGNSSSSTGTVTIEDSIAPTALCQDITVQLDACGIVSITAVDVDGGSTDTCGIAMLSIEPSSFSCADVGANTVTLTVTDVNDNSSSCTATVTVVDSIAPTAVCQDITVQLDATGNATITTAQIDNGSSDNCAIASLSLDQTTFGCNDIGSTTVTLTVTDTSGNSSSCMATVTVEDNTAPTAVCRDITVTLDENGNVTITAAQIDNGSTDNCSIASLSIDQDSFTTSDLGENTVTLTVTDSSGNTDTCTATVTVQAPNNLAGFILY
jgi:hypothetical protein